MDWDPELDVSLSNGRRVVTFQIAAVAGAHDEAWAVLEPGALRRVIRGRAAALATRQRVKPNGPPVPGYFSDTPRRRLRL
jgi:hypothetical protein